MAVCLIASGKQAKNPVNPVNPVRTVTESRRAFFAIAKKIRYKMK